MLVDRTCPHTRKVPGQDSCPRAFGVSSLAKAPWRAATPTLVPVAFLDTPGQVRRTSDVGVTGVARCC